MGYSRKDHQPGTRGDRNGLRGLSRALPSEEIRVSVGCLGSVPETHSLTCLFQPDLYGEEKSGETKPEHQSSATCV